MPGHGPLDRAVDESPTGLRGKRGLQHPDHSELMEVVRAQQQILETQEQLLRRSERLQAASLDKLEQLVELASKAAIERRSVSANAEYIAGAALASTLDDAWNFLSSHQLSLKKTLECLATSNMSFARFGDGEFKMMLSAWRSISFQDNSFELIEDLERVITCVAPNLLVGMPQFMRNDNYLKLWPKIWGHLVTLLDHSSTYGNSHVTRPLAFKFLGENAVELWREVWRDKKVCVITGAGSRFGLLPILFDSASSFSRIDSTPVNAYTDIARLEELCKVSDAELFLISLGPAGTILAHKLALANRRALDVGHLTAAYENIFEGKSAPEHTPKAK